MLYTAYNLIIDSFLPLPELEPVCNGDRGQHNDLTISLGSVTRAGLNKGKQCGPFHWISETSVWLHIPEVCRFLIEDGSRITIDPEAQANEDSIRLFLLGSAIGAILFQRGYLVLHGNAIKIGNSCMICVGESGAGKSTLAAGFMKHGFDILADDVVPIDNLGQAIPGFPRIKIWQDVAERLNISTHNLKRIQPGIPKFNFPLKHRLEPIPLPVRWVFVLKVHDQSDIRIGPVRGMNCFEPLLLNTYRNFYLDGMDLKPEHLQSCGKLAAQIHLATVSRPKVGFELDRLIDTLLDHMQQKP